MQNALSIPMIPTMTPLPENADAVPSSEERMEQLSPKIKLCNCGVCGKLLLGFKTSRTVSKMPAPVRGFFPEEYPAGRLNDKPACQVCLYASRPKSPFPPPAPLTVEKS